LGNQGFLLHYLADEANMMMETPKAYAEIHFTLERLLEAL
jgi:hypothetical protein